MVVEIGDITRLLTADLEAHFRQPWSVLPLAAICKGAGLLLGGFAVYGAVTAATG